MEKEMKTYIAKDSEIEAARQWFLVDVEGQILGRIASRIASLLKGKNKPFYSPHQDVGDFVIVVNAEKIAVTGNKLKDKIYHKHTGYPGGQKAITMETMLRHHPERIIELAVKRMLPKNALGRKMFRKLKVYVGSEHPHQAQQAVKFDLN
jgi:large subunit ribosomal protein L13